MLMLHSWSLSLSLAYIHTYILGPGCKVTRHTRSNRNRTLKLFQCGGRDWLCHHGRVGLCSCCIPLFRLLCVPLFLPYLRPRLEELQTTFPKQGQELGSLLPVSERCDVFDLHLRPNLIMFAGSNNMNTRLRRQGSSHNVCRV